MISKINDAILFSSTGVVHEGTHHDVVHGVVSLISSAIALQCDLK